MSYQQQGTLQEIRDSMNQASLPDAGKSDPRTHAGTYAAGNHAQYFPQGFPQGYQQQQPHPWQSSGQHSSSVHAQHYPHAAQTQQYNAYAPQQPQQTQQPSWYGVSEQPASWYGAQQGPYQGQAVGAGYTAAQNLPQQQPQGYGYNPEQAAHSTPHQPQAQQGYGYNPAHAAQQHAWQAQQQQQQQQQQYAYQQQYQQQYQYGNYGGPQAYSPYAYSQPYQPHSQSYSPNGSHPVPDANAHLAAEAPSAYNPNASEAPQPAAASAAPSVQHLEQVPEAPAAPVDVASLLFAPHRATRPHAIVVLVRGIPGSGKSWLAQKLRALEIENGGKPPRILSIDPFFMVELEDENTNSRSPSIREKYVHDAAKEASYEHALVSKLSQALCDSQHRFIIVDAPLLYAAALQSFCAVAKAAKYEVFVTQLPDQDPQRCFERNVHGRTAQDILEASRALERSPTTASKLNCDSIIPTSTPDNDSDNPPLPSDCPTSIEDSPQNTETKRKSVDIASVGGSEEKRARLGVGPGAIDDNTVLAMVDAGFSERAHPGGSGDSKKPSKQESRSRWSDDDDDDSEEGACAQVRSQNSQQLPGGAAGTSGGVDTKLDQLLGKRDKVRKSVRWPDQLGDEEDGAFRIGRPQQLETVHIIPGLGDLGERGPMDTSGGSSLSFSDAVRAEHQYEKQKLQGRGKGWQPT